MTGQRQRDITAWADAAFGGPWTSNARGVARMLEEVAELVTAVTTGAPPERVAGECADVMICALRLAAATGSDLEVGLAHWAPPEEVSQIFYLSSEILRVTSLVLDVVTHDRNPSYLLVSLASRLRELCIVSERDLWIEVDAKMRINRAREWAPDGTGCGRHVKTTTTKATAT